MCWGLGFVLGFYVFICFFKKEEEGQGLVAFFNFIFFKVAKVTVANSEDAELCLLRKA